MKCNMPINQETKIALAGEALEAALKDPSSPRCGQELAADDVFCSACGARVGKHSSPREGVSSCDSDSVTTGKCVVAWLKSLCKGRAPRKELWMVWLNATLFYAIIFFMANKMIAGNGRNIESRYLVNSMLSMAGFTIGICTVPVAVRRLHDLGYSGKTIIPSVCFSVVSTVLSLSGNSASLAGFLVSVMAAVYNLFLFVLLGFVGGTKGPNKYGADLLA